MQQSGDINYPRNKNECRYIKRRIRVELEQEQEREREQEQERELEQELELEQEREREQELEQMKIPKHLQEKVEALKTLDESLDQSNMSMKHYCDFQDLTRIIILEFQSHIEMLEKRNEVLVSALEFYAGMEQDKPNYKSKWVNHVCDSYSGLVSAFDWDGNIQDEPWDVAREALKRLRVE